MSEFVIAGGGTGGHLAPAIALAERLRDRGHATTILISRKAIDATLTSRYADHRFECIDGAPLVFTPAGILRFASRQLAGLWWAIGFLRRRRPAVVLGFGGFTTAAVIVAGWLLRIPVALHEANRVPGRAIRVLARFAKRVYLPTNVALPHVNARKLRFAGLPVRHEIERRPRLEAAAQLGLDANRRTVAVLGGSQGARSLNSWAETVTPELARHGVQMVTITGPDKGGETKATHPGPDNAAVTSVTLPFCHDMAGLISSADLVVSRAGAGTIAELVHLGVPAVLVPYPFAADNHQAANAAELAARGGGVVVEEDHLDELTTTVLNLVADPLARARCEIALANLARSESVDLMLADIEELGRVASPHRLSTREVPA